MTMNDDDDSNIYILSATFDTSSTCRSTRIKTTDSNSYRKLIRQHLVKYERVEYIHKKWHCRQRIVRPLLQKGVQFWANPKKKQQQTIATAISGSNSHGNNVTNYKS
jgi:hypothetical protein